jgi:hypothetical protein
LAVDQKLSGPLALVRLTNIFRSNFSAGKKLPEDNFYGFQRGEEERWLLKI